MVCFVSVCGLFCECLWFVLRVFVVCFVSVCGLLCECLWFVV